MNEITDEEAAEQLKKTSDNSQKIASFCEENGICIRDSVMAMGYLIGSLSSFLTKDEEQMEFLSKYIIKVKKMFDIAKSD